MSSIHSQHDARTAALESRTVLLTGCSSGIGRFTAEYLRSRGFRVLATARKDDDVQRLRDDGFEALLLDLNSTDSIQSATQSVLKFCDGALYGVVHNAGVEFLGALEDLGSDELRLCFETNVFGTMELTTRLLPAFRAQNFGRIVFVSSSNSNGFGYPYMGPGNASKCALECLATSLKRELAATKISVSTVCPGEISTNLLLNMVRRSERVLSSATSRHAHAYARLKKSFSSAPGDPSTRNLRPVAQAIALLLESKAPARRIVVPLSAKLHYLAHLTLPEWLQDKLLYRRMRERLGIHV
ncbi:MAG TPA: SDR family NAD(P)-dependent oxidoreductase [Polyangiaceae bacterium]|nr:SDR family NAD(P)-dependent oxidoreductase [Polyangiaceae bacterium]